MPRRNLYWMFLLVVISLLCYQRAERNRRGANALVLERFYRALEFIELDYIEPTVAEKLFQASMRGMTAELDEYTAYLNPEQYRDLRESLEGQFGGIGVQITLDPNTKQLLVMSPMYGTPAYKAGIAAGDRILAIDGESTEGFETRDAAERMRGKVGDSVRLTLLPVGRNEVVDVEVRREIIHVEAILGDSRLPDGRWNYFLAGTDKIGYLRLNSFNEQTLPEFKVAITELLAQNLKGLIIDLRDNPGGQLEVAVGLCDQFVSSGDIVSTRGRDGIELQRYVAHATNTLPDFPMTILVNRYSASASEIFAACLQDHHRAAIVGERSWGKGSVQHLLELAPNLDALKLTVATYWRPSGKNIHRLKSATDADPWGVSPNAGLEVRLSRDEVRQLYEYRSQRDVIRSAASPPATDVRLPTEVDLQLRKAVEYLDQALLKPRPATAAG